MNIALGKSDHEIVFAKQLVDPKANDALYFHEVHRGPCLDPEKHIELERVVSEITE
jgi:hypothetical protein